MRHLVAGLLALATAVASLSLRGEEIPQAVFTVERYVVVGDNPLSATRTQDLLEPFEGEHVGFAGLEAAADALQSALARAGYPFHRINIPPQTASGGEFTLEVRAFSLGAVEVRGNQHFSTENIRRSLPGLKSGTTPSRRALEGSLALANQHGSKRVRVKMRASDAVDRIDAVVEVEDRKPTQAFAAFNNRGSDESGRTRASLGFKHSNLFDRDHSLTVTGTASPGRASDVYQVGAFYRIPFYRWGSSLDL